MKKLSILLIGISIALSCEASTKTFKNPTVHEKTIVDNDFNEPVCLQSEAITINAENYGNYEYCFTGEGFGIVQGYNDSCTCGQFNYPSNGIDRHEWRSILTRNYNHKSTLTKLSVNYQGKSISKMPLQRTGTEDTGKGTADTKALYRKLKKAGYTVYYQNNRSTVYPKVDSCIRLVGRSVLFVDHPLHRFPLN